MITWHCILVCLLTFNLLQLGTSGVIGNGVDFAPNVYRAASKVGDRSRIVGGDLVNPGEIKYVVATLHDGVDVNCGGGIIGDYWVLTAAHCVYRNNAFRDKSLAVVAGVNDYKKVDDPRRVQVDVAQIYIPKRYTSDDERHDIAVLKLKKSLDIKKNNLERLLVPIKNGNETYLINRMALMAGFGSDNHRVYYSFLRGRYTTSGLLRKADIKIFDNAKCQDLYRNDYIYPSYLCGKMVKHSQRVEYGVCNGDSGSPLVYNKTIVGIVSWSYGCDERDVPLIYTRVSKYVDFIDDAIFNETLNMKIKVFK